MGGEVFLSLMLPCIQVSMVYSFYFHLKKICHHTIRTVCTRGYTSIIVLMGCFPAQNETQEQVMCSAEKDSKVTSQVKTVREVAC